MFKYFLLCFDCGQPSNKVSVYEFFFFSCFLDVSSDFYKHYKYRQGPVPGIHKHGHYIGFRHPKTTQERKQHFTNKKFVRAKRNANNLVDAWDDIFRSDTLSRTWKNTKKKKQWM